MRQTKSKSGDAAARKSARSYATGKRTPRRASRKGTSGGRWSRKVMETSNALDLESDIFKSNDPSRVAQSLKQSAETSRRRKGTPLQSAMSMLNFYINRAGKKLPQQRKSTLQKAKNRLRQLFGRPEK